MTINLNKERVLSQKKGDLLYIPNEVLREVDEVCLGNDKFLLEKFRTVNYNSINSIVDDGIDPNSCYSIYYKLYENKIITYKIFSTAFVLNDVKSVVKKSRPLDEFFFGIESLCFQIANKKIIDVSAIVGHSNLTDREFNECLIKLYNNLTAKRMSGFDGLYKNHNMFISNEDMFLDNSVKNVILNFLNKDVRDLSLFGLLEKGFEASIKINCDENEELNNVINMEYGENSFLINELRVESVKAKSKNGAHFIEEVTGTFKKVFFLANRDDESIVKITPRSRSLFIYNDEINKILNKKSFTSSEKIEILIKYKKNHWPLEVLELSLGGGLDFLDFIYDKKNETLIDERENMELKFPNLSKTNSLFLSYLLSDFKPSIDKSVFDILGVDPMNIFNLKEDDLKLLEMNCDWIMKRRFVLEYLMFFYNEFVKSLKVGNREFISNKSIKELRKVLKDTGYKINFC
jgi:hypothetical protein